MPKSTEEVADKLGRRYDREWRGWLRGEGTWPLTEAIGGLKEEDWEDAGRNIASWLAAWGSSSRQANVDWTIRRFRHRGELRIPTRIAFGSPADLAAWIGKTGHWNKAKALRATLLAEWPTAVNEIDRHLGSITEYDEIEFERFRSTVSWLAAHPASGLFRRAIPVRGIDSKWLEAHLSVTADFVAAVTGIARSGDALVDIGLKGPPQLVGCRMLSNRHRAAMGGIDYFTSPIEDISRLSIRPGTIIVIENLETMLALPDLADTMAILGAGYAVDALGDIPWLAERRLAYWGDLDTHGFAILNRARYHIPSILSVLMDRVTLLEHSDLWSFEPDQHRADLLERLTPEEGALFAELRENQLGVGVRLEQERIPLDWASVRLGEWVAG